ncbi:4-hydroxy-3-methylbut-2-enyl diphosphate reductase, partial [Thermus scotoductus]
MVGRERELRRLYLARPRVFCAGVVMASNTVERWGEAWRETGDLVGYHEIVHNRAVVERLRGKGVHFVEDLSEIDSLRREKPLAGTLVFSAHGHPPAVRRQGAEMGLNILDATCLLVTKVHTQASRYAREGYLTLLVGDHADHQEVKGTHGEAPE